MRVFLSDLRGAAQRETPPRRSVPRQEPEVYHQDPTEVVVYEFILRGVVEVISNRAPDENDNEWLNSHFFSVSSMIVIAASSKFGIRLNMKRVEGLVGSYFRARFGRDSCDSAKIPKHYFPL